MKKLFFLLAMTVSTGASAISVGNMGVSGYPEFTETVPVPPFTDDEFDWARYRREVSDYTTKAENYIESAEGDIQNIQQAQEDAFRKAKAVVSEYESHAK